MPHEKQRRKSAFARGQRRDSLAGESPEAVVSGLDFHRSCIYEWLAKYEANGEQGLATQPIPGRPKKFPGEYADRLRELLRTEFGERSVSSILARLGITVQRPRFKAYEQDPVTVKV